jgi:hypothetical protein
MIAASSAATAGPSQCPAFARELAGRLWVLFERDVEIARRLNDAGRRLRVANESETAVLGALGQARWTIDRALDALVAAGWSEEQARAADVHELAGAGVR